MGNAANPQLFGHGSATPTRELRWTVYRLRYEGRKLPRNEALATGRTGSLIIKTVGADASAYLTGEYGIDMGSLYRVRLRRLEATGGLLLHGTELYQTARELRDDPQAWWCVPAPPEA